MWADITGLTIKIPKEQEAASLGAAMIAAIAEGEFASYKEAAEKIVSFSAVYHPVNAEKYANKYNRFCKLYEASVAISDL
jgi:xylulokinase